MDRFQNPVLDDYQLMLVFKNIGVKLLQQLRSAMQSPNYQPFYKLAPSAAGELLFQYLDHPFKTVLELYFSQTKLPQHAQLTTYYTPANAKPEEIISYVFDLNYNVNDIYTLTDFAEYYLIEFHQNIKKTFSDNHLPFRLKVPATK